MSLIGYKINQVLIQLESKFPNVNSATSGEERVHDYGLLGEELSKAIEGSIQWFFNIVLSPIVVWGCKFVIVICIIIYYGSGEQRYISKSLLFLIIFIIFCAIRSAIAT